MMIFHLYLYFLMMVSVFQTKRDWLIFFHATLAASVIVAFMGMLQKFGYRISLQGGVRVDSTIGNPSYLAAYLSFHVWLILALVRMLWQYWWLRFVYTAALIFELLIIYFTATRGTAVALVLGIILLLGACVFYWKKIFPQRPQFRPWTAVFLAVAIVAPVIFWQIRSSDFVRSSPVLSRFASISLTDRTTRSRLAIWKMSFQGAMERPILGWGQENYYLVFQKYFDPVLWSSEPWFDRSHNIVLDWLVHAGVVGLAAFFSVIGGAFFALWKGVRSFRVDPWVGVAFGIALVGHLIQNFFVFDNLNTYLLFFSFLAYANHGSLLDVSVAASKVTSNSRFGGGAVRFWTIAGIAFFVFLVFLYPLHIKPIKESRALIRTLSIHQQGASGSVILAAFKEALSYKTFGDAEVREQLASFARSAATNERFTEEERVAIVSLALEEIKKEISRPTKDIKHMLFMAAILSNAKGLNPAYAREVEPLLKEAIRLSSTKQILYFELAQFYLQTGRTGEAIGELRQAWLVEPRNREAAVNLMIVGILAGNREVVGEVRAQFDETMFGDEGARRIGEAYAQTRDLLSASRYYEHLVKKYPDNAEYHTALAALFAEIGRIEEAREHAARAAELDPILKERVEKFYEYLNTK